MNRLLTPVALCAVILLPPFAVTAAAEPQAGIPGAASKFTSSVKSGFSKMTKALAPTTPKNGAPDPISLSVPAEPSADLHVAVARMAENSGDLGKAEQHYREALNLEPKNAAALMGYAHMLDRQGKLAQATKLYRMAVETEPNNPTAHNDLGICYARQGNLNQAVASLEKAIELHPKRARYRNNLATVLVQMEQVDAAFDQLSAVHPKAVAYYNLGYLLQKDGNKRGAARMFQEAISLNPSFGEARMWLQRLRANASPPATARGPETVARRKATNAPPRGGGAAPMPGGPSANRGPQKQPAGPGQATNQAAPRQLAPLPSIKPLPPIQRRN